MRFEVLGPLRVYGPDGEITPGGPRLRAVLALLLVRAGRTVTGDQLAEAVWDTAVSSRSRAALPSYVMRLRRALGPEAGGRVVTRSGGYAVEVDEGELDVRTFQELCERARALVDGGDPGAAEPLLGRALGLWRGEPLVDVPESAVLRAELDLLESARVRAQHQHIEVRLGLGRHAGLLGELAALAGAHPFDERLRAHLMLALHRSGRRAEALEVFQHGRQVLVDQLGIEPGTELQELHRGVLADDPALLLPALPLPAAGVPVAGVPVAGVPAAAVAVAAGPRPGPSAAMSGPGGPGGFAELSGMSEQAGQTERAEASGRAGQPGQSGHRRPPGDRVPAQGGPVRAVVAAAPAAGPRAAGDTPPGHRGHRLRRPLRSSAWIGGAVAALLAASAVSDGSPPVPHTAVGGRSTAASAASHGSYVARVAWEGTPADLVHAKGEDLEVRSPVRDGDTLVVTVLLGGVGPGPLTVTDTVGNRYRPVGYPIDQDGSRLAVFVSVRARAMDELDMIRILWPDAAQGFAAVDDFRGVTGAGPWTETRSDPGSAARGRDLTLGGDPVPCEDGDLLFGAVGSDGGPEPDLPADWHRLPVVERPGAPRSPGPTDLRLTTAYLTWSGAPEAACEGRGTASTGWRAVLFRLR
ncbi:AfsR/SARP family transcriptional regulator [Kitasatospora sp. MBT66]|uniref:AfsR/SARP family transcriptional regulator n=1 Tax=Kitasatospora sp. MBT66 TaxID=1444769 RepID=UPI000689BD27|nr:AfsR/SARP family transcriptional regulator [Kitasatospora sp. MBT66]